MINCQMIGYRRLGILEAELFFTWKFLKNQRYGISNITGPPGNETVSGTLSRTLVLELIEKRK